MSAHPLGYDLFSGAGGATRGYEDVGFRMLGVDISPQPRYCGTEGFVQMDALEFVAAVMRGEFEVPDFWHASPPCQGYSIMRNLPWLRDKVYPLLIDPTRAVLKASGRPWVIENVMGAHLPAGWLCGTMFGLPFYRHRAFESSFAWFQPSHEKHGSVISSGRNLGDRARTIVYGNGAQAKGVGIGHAAGWRSAADAMGIDWMTRDELTQAIPPVYTAHVGRFLWLELGM